MVSHTSVIVNHRVALPGTSAHGAVATHRLDYVRTRLGVVREPTGDDIRRHDLAEREAALGYISHRRGVVLDEGGNCALFDAGGVADYRQVKAELMAAKGAILTSVVAVRREDAEVLGLQTKQDFERFLRANWQEHLEQMGIIEPQDVRWVGAFHINSDKNFHAHVISWDDSGRFNSLISKAELENARQDLVAKATAPARQKINSGRMQTREGLVAGIRNDELSEAQRRKMLQIIDSLPERGSLKYGSMAKNVPGLKAEIDGLVENRINESAKLAAKVGAYRKTIEHHANLKGLKGSERQAYEAAAMDDLRARLGNAQLIRIKQEAGIVDGSRRCRPSVVPLLEGERVAMPIERKREQVIAQEISSCLTGREKEELAAVLKEGRRPTERLTAKVAELPALKQYMKHEKSNRAALKERIALNITRFGAALGSVFDQAAGNGKGDAGDDVGCRTIRFGARAACAVASQVLKAIKVPKFSEASPAIREHRQSFKMRR